MTEASDIQPVYRVRMWPKDLGVALAALAALAAGLLLMGRADGQVRQFESANPPFKIAYPAGWNSAQSLQNALLKAEDPEADSTFKTTLTVESRDLDPQNPPTIQTLVDRRVAERAQLTGYHFLTDDEATVAGAKAIQLQYAYVAQPIDLARRASLPVVVRAREYVVVTKDRTYNITLAAPENEFERASARFDRMLQTVVLQ